MIKQPKASYEDKSLLSLSKDPEGDLGGGQVPLQMERDLGGGQ